MEEIVAPDFGESVFEASVGRWFKDVGDTVNVGEPIVELHTDKAVQEINAVQSGTIGTIIKQVDDVVRPGDALCEFNSDIAVAADVVEEVPSESVEPVETSTETDEVTAEDEVEIEPEEEDAGYVEIQLSPFVELQSATQSEPPTESTDDEPEQEEIEIDETSVLVEVEDTVEATIEPEEEAEPESDAEPEAEPEPEVEAEPEPAPEVEPEPEPAPAVAPEIAHLREEEDGKPVRRERLSRRRLTTARRMAQVQAEAVMTTTYNEVDMHEVIRIRRDFGAQFLETNGVKLGFMSFFVKAVINGLKAFPILNSELDGDELVYKEYHDIGVAVASDHGLVVPVIRNADNKTFADIEREISGFAESARTGSFSLADLVGGTFTITNGGVFGSMMSTPILNPPQVGILGMHNIVDRPVVVDGQITIRPTMYLAVTYDHRVVEGAQAVQFLMRVKQSLESAELLMLAS